MFKLFNVYSLKYFFSFAFHYLFTIAFYLQFNALCFICALLRFQYTKPFYTPLYNYTNIYTSYTTQPLLPTDTHTLDTHYLTCSPAAKKSPTSMREQAHQITVNHSIHLVRNIYYLYKTFIIRISILCKNGG